MTISSTTNKDTYSGNGSTTVFPYTFKILDDDEILVQVRTTSSGVITTKTLTTDYTVSGAGEDSGGNVTFGTAPASGTTVILLRNLDAVQETDYPEYDPFPASSHEEALDRLTMLIQKNEEVLARCLKLDPTADIDVDLNAVGGGGQLLKLNTAGTGFEFTTATEESISFLSGAGTGILVQDVSLTSTLVRTLTGTANEISIADGDGVSGNPTFSLPSALTFTGKTVTGGTFTQPVITIDDDEFTLQDNSDTTKKLNFQLSGITTSTTRTLTVPDANTTIVGTDATQTLTNKTFTSPVFNTGVSGSAIATQSNMESASSTSLLVTPGRQHYHPSACKAWVKFNGTGTVAINGSYNTTSITDNGTGNYTWNIATDFSDTNYSYVASCNNDSAARIAFCGSQTAGTCTIISAVSTTSTAADSTAVMGIAFGDQ